MGEGVRVSGSEWVSEVRDDLTVMSEMCQRFLRSGRVDGSQSADHLFDHSLSFSLIAFAIPFAIPPLGHCGAV